MDVQAPELTLFGRRVSWWPIGLLIIVLVAAALRLAHVTAPILDHPAWRQGDTASIARNFALLRYNILYPQTMYNGPPPNYVELELQLVPFLAATLYKIVGVHAVIGRLITIAFSTATVAVVGIFARWMFRSWIAGLFAAIFYAIAPGSIYYGRTFTPDATMVFFLTAALYVSARFLVEDEALSPRNLARATGLLTLAYLTKPVALVAFLPVAALAFERWRAGRTVRASAIAVLLAVPLFVLWSYDRAVAAHAEWHWASGITTLHVLPALRDAFTSPHAFIAKAQACAGALGMLWHTMLGPAITLLAIAGFALLPWSNARSKTLLWTWLAGGLLYTYAVVTVERVDYYLFLMVPLAALVAGLLFASAVRAIETQHLPAPPRTALYAVIGIALLAMLLQSRSIAAPYYRYEPSVLENARMLDRRLPRNAIVVIGHYGPDVQYFVNRFGWEEDPLLWTPFDEQSAIRKGARFFISIEDNRLRRNLELCAWMQRFPVIDAGTTWTVYDTDPSLVAPDAERWWQQFRSAGRSGRGRAFLDAHDMCKEHDHATTRA